jgi:hypothetical protein
MTINKTLYFLHIPKTAGMTVGINFAQFLKENNLSKYPPSPPPHGDVSSDYAFIQGHLGRYPISKIENLSVATLVRDPLDRAISNFLYIYNRVLSGREEYLNLKTIEAGLKYYLFDDPDYTSHRNIQSKFICSEPEENIFKDIPTEQELDYANRSKQWYLKDVDIDIDLVKSYIDQFEIVNTTANIPVFMNRLVDWFNENYPELKTKSLSSEILNINESLLTFTNKTYTTESVKTSLSDEDVMKFLDLNSIDFELYEYVYNLERQ